MRRRWLTRLRTQAVIITAGPVQQEAQMHAIETEPGVLTRAQRAHCRLRWDERLARNARLSSAPPLEITIYGLSTVFAQTLGLQVA